MRSSKKARVGSFAVVMLALLVAGGHAVAQPGSAPSGPKNPPPLDHVQWAGAPVSYKQLRGKAVFVFVYATWCPKCNAWSGKLFQQIRESLKGKPGVVLAINADTSPAGAKSYLQQRGFFAPNILHGYDPQMHKRMGQESNLFRYAIVGPDGDVLGFGYGGERVVMPDGRQLHKIAYQIEELTKNARFHLIDPAMPAEVKTALWPCELGGLSEAALRAATRSLTPEHREIVEKTVDELLEQRIATIRENYKGSLEERFTAYDLAAELAQGFPSASQGKKAEQVIEFMESDGDFKREVTARRLFNKAMNSSADARRLRIQFRSLGERFEGTLFGDKAMEQAVALQQPR